MGFTRGESPLQSRMAKAGRKILGNLKNQFRPKKKNKIEVHMQRGNYQNATDYGMYYTRLASTRFSQLTFDVC